MNISTFSNVHLMEMVHSQSMKFIILVFFLHMMSCGRILFPSLPQVSSRNSRYARTHDVTSLMGCSSSQDQEMSNAFPTYAASSCQNTTTIFINTAWPYLLLLLRRLIMVALETQLLLLLHVKKKEEETHEKE